MAIHYTYPFSIEKVNLIVLYIKKKSTGLAFRQNMEEPTMAYDEVLARRIEKLMKEKEGFSKREMFGGIGYMINGNMCLGVHKGYLILRLGKNLAQSALKGKHTRPFDITGRPMSGWVMVDRNGTRDEDALQKWIDDAMSFVKTLPPKD